MPGGDETKPAQEAAVCSNELWRSCGLADAKWLSLWNLPLHAWSWNIIEDVTHLVGDLVALSHAELPHKHFISVLVHRKAGISLPLELNSA